MAEMMLTRMRLAEGVWEGLLDIRGDTPPRLGLRHRDELVADAETTETIAGKSGFKRWLVRVRLPAERLSDGVQTFVIEDTATGDALAHETVVAGDPLNDDLRAEVAILRAELDMLKRAFRRHCTET